jgi:hypothetical protein
LEIHGGRADGLVTKFYKKTVLDDISSEIRQNQ